MPMKNAQCSMNLPPSPICSTGPKDVKKPHEPIKAETNKVQKDNTPQDLCMKKYYNTMSSLYGWTPVYAPS
jgi:hypothetical protein